MTVATGKRLSKYQWIAREIRGELASNAVAVGAPFEGTREVAERFGVSALTAHRALGQLVAEGALYRVKGSGTFVGGGGVARPKGIGFVETEFNPYLNDALNSSCHHYIDYVFEYFRSRGYEVHMLRLREVRDRAFLAGFAGKLAGLLVNIDFNDPVTMENLDELGLPLVVYRSWSPVDLPFSQVFYDFSGGISGLFAGLTPGIDDPPVMICENNPNGLALSSLIREYAVSYGYAPDCLVSETIPFIRRAAACYKMVRVYRDRFAGRLILSLADGLTMELVGAFAEEGMQPGRDYRIVTVGNCEEYGVRLFDAPSLAAVDLPRQLMADEACRLLCELIREPSAVQHLVKIPTSFIMRRSAEPIEPEWMKHLHEA